MDAYCLNHGLPLISSGGCRLCSKINGPVADLDQIPDAHTTMRDSVIRDIEQLIDQALKLSADNRFDHLGVDTECIKRLVNALKSQQIQLTKNEELLEEASSILSDLVAGFYNQLPENRATAFLKKMNFYKTESVERAGREITQEQIDKLKKRCDDYHIQLHNHTIRVRKETKVKILDRLHDTLGIKDNMSNSKLPDTISTEKVLQAINLNGDCDD